MDAKTTEIVDRLLDEDLIEKDVCWLIWLQFTDNRLTSEEQSKLIELQERYFGYGYEK